MKQNFTKDGNNNFHNYHTWFSNNPYAVDNVGISKHSLFIFGLEVLINLSLQLYVLNDRLRARDYKEFLKNHIYEILAVGITSARILSTRRRTISQ